ncbi:amyloid-beta-like protein isoform X2 [Leptopilina boulardi]|uniref:amyloid-beta-like protein isoform X2 n=1 Tax=Leptopilina boulardi TaxID=63433 RepID=UPI0021F53C43|nr:amyloid-beta-like protein isoform X2 [Leptopilina boulardi]
MKEIIKLVLALGFFIVQIKGISERLELASVGGRFEPQVATLCESDDVYMAQHMGEQGRWISSNDQTSCLKSNLEILKYCKKAYPKRDITNIVESSHYIRISGWCKPGKSKCKLSRWIKPYRCLGPFQSDALLVPEGCLFDHLHNQTKCWESHRWNSTAADTCNERNMNLRSFAMLLPCGISLFAGVEFVCCPKYPEENVKSKQYYEVPISRSFDEDLTDNNDDEDEDDDNNEEDEIDGQDTLIPGNAEDSDSSSVAEIGMEDILSDQSDDPDSEEYLEDYDTVTRKISTSVSSVEKKYYETTVLFPVSTVISTTPQIQGTQDPYMTNFDPRSEHKSYKQAQMRLEEVHKEKVTKVMKDWSDLEERYQDIRARDPIKADEFKRWMTTKFQETVAALEASGTAEKHQLSALHQQRVQESVRQRNEDAMSCYTASLNEIPPNMHRIQKCLQKLLRALHKDRHHTIAHYKHLLDSSIEQAQREKSSTLEHLAEINKVANQSILMLERYPELSAKIGQLMDNYVLALRSKDETPGLFLAMPMEAEAAILDKFQAEVTSKQQEKEHQKQLERERKEQRKAERGVQRSDKEKHNVTKPDVVKEDVLGQVNEELSQVAAVHSEGVVRASHNMLHDISHSESSYSVRREIIHRESRSLYYTLAFAGIALTAAVIVGVAIFKRRNARNPHRQGFIEVDQAATPEERHVANMQINGYENPTYKYFEVKE